MEIHVVQPGETIETIAQMFSFPVGRLIQDNGLTVQDQLVAGQTIVIAYPEQTYIVQEGDTLIEIADKNNTTVLQLYRNNPFLTDRDYIYTGETLVISYDNSKGKITTNGYTSPYINKDILIKTLPFLTYLTVFGYRLEKNAEIIDIDDSEVIELAKEFGVAPIMMLSTLTEQGVGSVETAYSIFYNKDLQDILIGNIISLLRRKGYYGLDINYLYLSPENRLFYEDFTRKLESRLKSEGYFLFVTITPLVIIQNNIITFEKINYSELGQAADGIIIMSYNWGYNYGPPGPIISIASIKEFLEYALPLIPKEKTDLGFSLTGYVWELPYIIGSTKANSLTIDSTIALARQHGANIEFDEVSQTPYFRYIDESSGVPRNYIVWFIDSRSIEAITELALENGISGIGIWNIMQYFPQMWLVINSQYQIETILP